MNEPLTSSTTPVHADYALPAQLPAQTPTNPDAAQTASDLLNVGSRPFSGDDYDARAEAFGEAIQQGDQAYREALFAEILRQDPNALNSWLTLDRINGMVESGQISPTARNAMAEAFAGAYNNGLLPSQDIVDSEGNVIGTENALDAFLPGNDARSGDGIDQAVQHARDMSNFAEFFGGPHYSAEISEFRANYSEHLINDYALNDNVEDNALRDDAATQAAILLTGDPTRGDIAATVLQSLDDGQLTSFMECVARGGETLTANYLEGIVPNSTIADVDDLSVDDIALDDPFSTLLAQVARTDTLASREVATELARLPAQSGDLFDEGTFNYQERVDAMGQLFINHSDSILDSLTEYNTDRVGSTEHPDAKQYMQDAADLGTLLKLVVFNEDSTHAATAQEDIIAYAADLKEQINTPEGSAEAVGRLSMLAGAADDAITQGYNDLAAEQAAQRELVSFIVDVALAGIPLDKLKDGASDLLGDVFDNPNVTEALDGITGDLIDSATGTLTEASEEALIGALGEDEAELLVQQEASNALRNALIGGITDEDRAFQVKNGAEDVTQGINIWRD